MPNTYRNDQWFGLGNEDALFTPINSGPARLRAGYNLRADNKPFIYPDRLIRTNDANGVKTEALKRGYVRSLLYDGGQANFVSKCAFQFNPEALTHSVNASTTLQNPMFLDPSSFATPIMGDVTFVFDLLFDRSMELNNYDPTTADPDKLNTSNRELWLDSDPSEVGVLHDLAAFYRVIGQGFYEDSLTSSYQLDVLKKANDGATPFTSTPEVVSSTAPGAVPFGAQTNADLTYVAGAGNANTQQAEWMSSNIGNVAFLVPLPIRVVFSSLYMVEGFVQQCTVTFHKFTTNMVPMNCTVNVSMAAKYIGFAKKNSSLSASLVAAKEAVEQEAARRQQDQETVFTAFKRAAANIEVSLHQYPNGGPTELSTLYDEDRFEATVLSLTDTLQAAGTEYFLAARFPNGPQPVSDMYTRGANISVVPTAQFNLYGPFDQSAVPTGRALEEIARIAKDLIANINDPDTVTEALLTASLTPRSSGSNNNYPLANSANNKDTWEKITKLAPSGPKRTTYGFTPDYPSVAGKFILVELLATVNVTFDGASATASGARYLFVPLPADYLLSEGELMKFSVPLTWTTSSVPASDGGPTAPGNRNPVSSPLPPGVQSNVGAPPPRPSNNLTTAKTSRTPVRYQ